VETLDYGLPYRQAASEFNVIYGRDGSVTFPAPIFTKLAHDQQHYVQISSADFHEALNDSVNVFGHFPCRFYSSRVKNAVKI
jgi:hypothetical protein